MDSADTLVLQLKNVNPVFFSARKNKAELPASALSDLRIRVEELTIDGEYIENARLGAMKVRIERSAVPNGRPHMDILGEARIEDPELGMAELVNGALDEPDAEITVSLSASLGGESVELVLLEEPMMYLSRVEVMS